MQTLGTGHTAMKTTMLLGTALMLFVCAAVNAQTPSQTPLGFNASLKPTLATFSGLPDGVTYPELVRRAGLPDKDVGSGIHIFMYQLADGSTVSVRTSDLIKLTITHIAGTAHTQLYPVPK